MKYTITKKQWDELDEKKKNRILDFFGYHNQMIRELAFKNSIHMKIGQMIEFLGYDLIRILGKDKSDEEYDLIRILGKDKSDEEYGVVLDDEQFNGNICDALWEACKYKLNS